MAKTYGEMVDAGTPMSAIFDQVLKLHQALKAAPVKERVWEYEWTSDGHEWRLRLNGHLTHTVDRVPPVHIVIERDGWPVMMGDMFSGSVMGLTEDVVIAALAAEVEAHT